MQAEPIVTNRPPAHAAVLAGAVVVAVVLASALSWLLSGETRSAGFSALITAVSWIPAGLPILLGSKTVPSRFGGAVLFGSMGHTLATLGLAMLVTMTADIEPRPVMAGVLLGAFVVLSAQVGYAIWVLRHATPAGGRAHGEGG